MEQKNGVPNKMKTCVKKNTDTNNSRCDLAGNCSHFSRVEREMNPVKTSLTDRQPELSLNSNYFRRAADEAARVWDRGFSVLLTTCILAVVHLLTISTAAQTATSNKTGERVNRDNDQSNSRVWAVAYTDFDPDDGPYLADFSSGNRIAMLLDNGDGKPGAGDIVRFGSFPKSMGPVDRTHNGRVFPKNTADVVCTKVVTSKANGQEAICTVDGEMWSRRIHFAKSSEFPRNGNEYYGEYWIDMAWFVPLPGGSGAARLYERLSDTADYFGYLTMLADYANSSQDFIKLCSRSPSLPEFDINCSPGAEPGASREGNDNQFIDVDLYLP